MARSDENRGFRCAVCSRTVTPLTNGSYRNHCPHCLASLHLDVAPGDRASGCGGIMDAIGVEHSSRKGAMLVHRCRRCGVTRRNRSASDTREPDDLAVMIELVARTSIAPHRPRRHSFDA